jgi:hypothetical protein
VAHAHRDAPETLDRTSRPQRLVHSSGCDSRPGLLSAEAATAAVASLLARYVLWVVRSRPEECPPALRLAINQARAQIGRSAIGQSICRAPPTVPVADHINSATATFCPRIREFSFSYRGQPEIRGSTARPTFARYRAIHERVALATACIPLWPRTALYVQECPARSVWNLRMYIAGDRGILHGLLEKGTFSARVSTNVPSHPIDWLARS